MCILPVATSCQTDVGWSGWLSYTPHGRAWLMQQKKKKICLQSKKCLQFIECVRLQKRDCKSVAKLSCCETGQLIKSLAVRIRDCLASAHVWLLFV